MALFWHHVFATGNAKIDNGNVTNDQIEMFREHGMGNYRELLMRLAKDPGMIYWLDNNENHRDSVNENWGRELLELFSMGVDNYTETDVREASRAFTGWTKAANIPRLPYGRYPWYFEYREEDHDDTEKTFLGHTGNFNGEDIIDIVVKQPATSRFICRHLYNFFVADEVQVPAWTIEPARDEEALAEMVRVFEESGYEIEPVLRTMFNSQFFKDARFSKIKSPAEVVAGTLRLVGDWKLPQARDHGPGAATQVHGPGPYGPAQRRRLVHRQGMDKQRLVVGPRQLHRRQRRQHQPAGGEEYHRRYEGRRRDNARAVGRGGPGPHGLPGACRRYQSAIVGLRQEQRRPGLG